MKLKNENTLNDAGASIAMFGKNFAIQHFFKFEIKGETIESSPAERTGKAPHT
jgi:hypothetical protein